MKRELEQRDSVFGSNLHRVSAIDSIIYRLLQGFFCFLPSFFLLLFPSRERVDTLIIKSTSSRHAHSASRNYSRRVNVHGFVWISKYMRICNTKPFVSWTEKLLYIIRSFFLQAFPRVETFEFLNYIVAGNNSKQTAREIRVWNCSRNGYLYRFLLSHICFE